MSTYDYGHNGQEMVQAHSDYLRLSATASATVLASAGRIAGVFCSTIGDGAKLTLRDQAASADANQIISGLTLTAGTFYDLYNVRCKTGIFASVLSATGSDITIFFLNDKKP